MPVNTLINFRKGSDIAWSGANPVLSSGEPGFDLTNNILKIGDGSTPWNSLSSHSHFASNIIDLNSSVSGLLPITNITGNSGVLISQTGTSYNISTTGLAYLSGANFDSNLTVNNIPVSVSGHTHVSSDITNFDVAVSGYVTENILPPSVTIYSGSGDLLAGSSNGIHYIYIFRGNAINSALILPPGKISGVGFSVYNKSMYTIKNQTSGTIYIKTSNSETIDDYHPSPLPSGSVIGLSKKYSSISLICDQDDPIPQWNIV